jgi:hypothetical protein
MNPEPPVTRTLSVELMDHLDDIVEHVVCQPRPAPDPQDIIMHIVCVTQPAHDAAVDVLVSGLAQQVASE